MGSADPEAADLNVNEDAGSFGIGYRDPVTTLPLTRAFGSSTSLEEARVAEEVPVALVYAGRSHAVMMCTPLELQDFAVGFSVTEGIVQDVSQLLDVREERHRRGIELRMEIPPEVADRLLQRSRAISGRTGCGLCGVEAIEDAVRPTSAVGVGPRVTRGALFRAGRALELHQPLNAETRAIHAAAWATPDGALEVVREDVGRHNALDKVLGALLRRGRDPTAGFLLVTSRASFELVQKAAVLGIGLLAAVSRPTALAVGLADASGMTLVGLLRGDSANLYTHPHRISGGLD